MTFADEPRLITEPGRAARVALIVAPALAALGYRLVRVRISGAAGQTVQIMAERPDGTMTIEDCELASRALSPVLDVADPIEGAVSAGDFLAGHRPAAGAALGLRPLCRTCRRKWRCWCPSTAAGGSAASLLGTDGDCVRLRRSDAAAGGPLEVLLRIDDMMEARLVLTDALIAESLRRSKHEERAARAREAVTKHNRSRTARTRRTPTPRRRRPAAQGQRKESEPWRR